MSHALILPEGRLRQKIDPIARGRAFRGAKLISPSYFRTLRNFFADLVAAACSFARKSTPQSTRHFLSGTAFVAVV